jgi:hypothetical protein
LQIFQWKGHIVSEQFGQDKECNGQFTSLQKLQYFKQFKHTLFVQFIKAHLIIASLSHLIQETKDISSGHDEHLIEHFLQINFLQILQNREQFIHIRFLHKLFSQILIQEKSILILHNEQILFELIKLLFFALCFKQLSLFSFPHKVIQHFLQI